MIHDPNQDPALALIELRSIARAFLVGDAMVKKAPIRILVAEPVSPGRYLILIAGDEASVDESYLEGLAVGDEQVLDKLILPGVHGQLLPAIGGRVVETELDSLGVVETDSVASCLLAADAACKCTDVTLLEMRLGMGIGGKGAFSLTGPQYDVEAALEASARILEGTKRLVQTALVPRPDPAFNGLLRGSVAPFGARWPGGSAG